MMSDATPRPWELSGLGYRVLKGAEIVAMCDTQTCSAEEARANAALIVTAVNAHEALVGAGEDALEWFEDTGRTDNAIVSALRAALAAAKAP